MPESSVVKYLVRLKFDIEGVVERADVIGAIFGQTEGLFGPEMNLHELQRQWKVGRIEINLDSKGDRTTGEVLIPMSTDVSTAALIAAAVESVEKVGPCVARFTLGAIEDVRATKRKTIAERAKLIMKEWASKTTSEGETILRDVTEATKRARLVTFGPDELPAGPGVYTADTVYLVEGRADVINLLRAGIENVLALEGTKIPDSVMRLVKEKKVIAFLDGDRAGDLILRELDQVAPPHRVFRAPTGKEVEDLTPMEILSILRGEAPAEAPRAVPEVKPGLPEPVLTKMRDLYPQINGTLEGVLLDEDWGEVGKVPVNELVQRLEQNRDARSIVFDGIVTQRLVDTAERIGARLVIGHRMGDISRRPNGLTLHTFRDLGLE
jgi:DNA primase